MLAHLLTGTNPKQLLGKAIKLWNQPLKATSHPDFHLLPEDESVNFIGIGDIRKLIKALQLKPVQAKTKLAVIQNAHLLTIEAQNALLKILEEPPKSVQLILTTSRPNALLPTILSRVVKIKVKNQEILESAFLSKKDFEKQLISLLEIEPSIRLIQTPTIGKDRNSAREFVLQCLHFFHQQLINKTPDINTPVSFAGLEKVNALKSLAKAINYLNSNTHPQLTIDNLLLRLPLVPSEQILSQL